MFFDKKSYCVEYVEQTAEVVKKSKVRVLDRFQYKLEGERSEPKIFITIDQTFFHEQTIFFPQVAEQTIYFLKFAEQSFFSQKNHSPPGIKWSAPKI